MTTDGYPHTTYLTWNSETQELVYGKEESYRTVTWEISLDDAVRNHGPVRVYTIPNCPRCGAKMIMKGFSTRYILCIDDDCIKKQLDDSGYMR